MPIIIDAHGHSRYVSVSELLKDVRPKDFFVDRQDEYEDRVFEARSHVLDAIRYAHVPLSGRGTSHEVRSVGSELEDLARYVDGWDGHRATLLKKQRLREANGLMGPFERRRRSPQPIHKRRSVLFSGTDIPVDYFRVNFKCDLGKQERAIFMEIMRLHLIQAAVNLMYEHHEIALLNDIWYVKVSVMDVHPSARRQRRRKSVESSHRVKRDDRSFHGMPNRDRDRVTPTP
jgi:hypothetical protein